MGIVTLLTGNPFPHPFIDWEWIPSAVACWHRGVDVYADNTCYKPILHGTHNYSPLWLRMTFLPDGKVWLAPFGIAFGVLFFAALATLPPQRRARPFLLTVLATFSSMTAFALERGNVDLVMFVLAIVGVNCWFGCMRLRLVGYSIFLLAGLLKFYPLVLLALALRERLAVFAGVSLVTLGVLTAFGLGFHDELARIGDNLPRGAYFAEIFASSNLPDGLGVITGQITNNLGSHGPSSSDVASNIFGPGFLLLVLTLTAFLRAARLVRRLELHVVIAAMPPREAGFLVAGALLICGCFFAGQNVDYRAILILPTLPGLLWLGCSLPDRTARIDFVGTCGAIVFVMWKLAIRQIIALSHGGEALFLVHWMIDELAWWWVISILLAVLLAFMHHSTMGRWALRPITPPTQASRAPG